MQQGPYRQAAPVLDVAPATTARDPEASIIYALLALVGGPRLAIVWPLEEPFGTEATVALVFVVLGLVGLGIARLRR